MTDTMFSTREVPWIKLGKLVNDPLTVEDAVREGGLDFTVSARPIQYETPDGWVISTQRKMIVRDDTQAPFDIVSATDYSIFQYREAFDFLSAVNTRFVAAGTLKGGRQAFMVIQFPDTEIGGDASNVFARDEDQHTLYGIVRTSHDRTRAIEVVAMPLRGRCMNQLTLSTFAANAPNRIAIRHVGDMATKMYEAQIAVTFLQAYGVAFADTAQRLLNVKLDDDEAANIVGYVIRDSARKDDTVEQIMASYQTSELVGYHGTGWGLVNAVSEYFDWGRSGGSSQSRFLGALEGATSKAINVTAGRVLALAG
jgi:phage/plasmid-like protein (TIGR03299 family)